MALQPHPVQQPQYSNVQGRNRRLGPEQGVKPAPTTSTPSCPSLVSVARPPAHLPHPLVSCAIGSAVLTFGWGCRPRCGRHRRCNFDGRCLHPGPLEHLTHASWLCRTRLQTIKRRRPPPRTPWSQNHVLDSPPSHRNLHVSEHAGHRLGPAATKGLTNVSVLGDTRRPPDGCAQTPRPGP